MGKSSRNSWLTMIVVVLLGLSVMMLACSAKTVGADSVHRPMRRMESAHDVLIDESAQDETDEWAEDEPDEIAEVDPDQSGPEPVPLTMTVRRPRPVLNLNEPQRLPLVVRDAGAYTANMHERNQEIQDMFAAFHEKLERLNTDATDLLNDFCSLNQIAKFLCDRLEKTMAALMKCSSNERDLTRKLSETEEEQREQRRRFAKQRTDTIEWKANYKAAQDLRELELKDSVRARLIKNDENIALIENTYAVKETQLQNAIRSCEAEKDRMRVELQGQIEEEKTRADTHWKSVQDTKNGLAKCQIKVKDLEKDATKKENLSRSKDQLVSHLKKHLDDMKIKESSRAQSIAELQEKVNLRQLFNNFRNSVIGRLYDRHYLLDLARKIQADELQRRAEEKNKPKSKKKPKAKKENSLLNLADIRILDDKLSFSSVVISLVDEKTRLKKLVNADGTTPKQRTELEKYVTNLSNQIKALKKVAAQLQPTDEEVEKAGGFAWSTRIGETYAQWCMYTAEANEACHPDVSGNELLKSIKVRAQEGRYIHNNHDMKDIIVAVIDHALQDDGQEFNE